MLKAIKGKFPTQEIATLKKTNRKAAAFFHTIIRFFQLRNFSLYVSFCCRLHTKCFRKLDFLRHLKFQRTNSSVFSLHWKVGTTIFLVSKICSV